MSIGLLFWDSSLHVVDLFGNGSTHFKRAFSFIPIQFPSIYHSITPQSNGTHLESILIGSLLQALGIPRLSPSFFEHPCDSCVILSGHFEMILQGCPLFDMISVLAALLSLFSSFIQFPISKTVL